MADQVSSMETKATPCQPAPVTVSQPRSRVMSVAVVALCFGYK